MYCAIIVWAVNVPLTIKSSADDAVRALYAQEAVPKSEPVNEPLNEPLKEPVKFPVVAPITTISSPLDPDFFIKARPS